MSDQPHVVEKQDDKPTDHGKRSKSVFFILIGLVVLALVFNTVAQFKDRAARQKDQEENREKKENAEPARPESKLTDFAAEQAKTADQAVARESADKEAERRRKILEGTGLTDSDRPQNKGPDLNTPEGVEQAFLLTERKRALEAIHGGALPVRERDNRNGGQQAQQSTPEVSKVDAQIAAIESKNDALIKRQAELRSTLEQVRGGAFPAGAFRQQTTQGAATGDTFGELAPNRAATLNPGPKPGEKLLPVATVIPAILDQDVISDYAGNWIGVVQRPVYDVEMENVLIPAGTKIYGKAVRAAGVNEAIQSRMGLLPQWFIRPDGKRIDLRRATATDTAGVAALKDQVDRHFLAQFMGVGAYALIGLGPSFSNYGTEANTARDAFVREATGKARETGRAFAEKYLNIVPSVRIRAGTAMKIILDDDLYITPWEEVNAGYFTNRR